MAIVTPTVRKHLSADALFHVVRSGFANIPDPRCEDADISLTDALMSAFAMFSLKAPSLLAFDKERAEGNLHTIYGIQRVPCDTHMREILDPVSPKWLRPVFTSVFRQLQLIVTEDSLSSNAPHIETLHNHALHYILGVKEGDHSFLFQQVQAAEHAGRVTSYERHDRAAGVSHRFRFVNDVPLNASNVDVRVNFIEYWEMGQDKVQHFSWITDLRVTKRNVFHLIRGGRARWKIENETFNTLKNQGYHFEHNYGHGMQNLSVVFAMLMMLAFLVDQAQQLCCALFQTVWAKLGSKRMLWERMRALFYDYALTSMRQLFEALLYGLKQPVPVFDFDSS